ncbi:TolC family outer membrane protein [Ramlibacter sp. 2FC]|uniref:TolC family outer membrane protein n=1 Tax=Ramlibacter sp. 2FC TaxID=2502188 RepID=UPI0010F8C6FC|nr:TolC family outer membrane protein [Ramlibacter sp. 2FC]
MTTMPRRLPLTLALAALFALPAQAQSLVELYESARGFDASYQSARAQYEANLAKAAQTRAGLLPTANLAANAARTNQDNLSTGAEREFDTRTASVTASQPLYRPANLATAEQGDRQIEQARAQLQTAEQDLIVRVSQAYFDVLGAQDSLTFVQAQKAAVAEQLAAAKRNFEVGTATITDTREAQARYDLVLAQEIAAENDLRVKKLALDQLVGQTGTQPRPLALPATLPALQPEDVNTWVQQAGEGHPGVQQQRLALDIARLETRKAEAGHKPTLDLTASYGRTRFHNPVSTTTQPNTNTTTLGLAFNLPLFAGFATQNRVRETLALEDKARADLDATQRNVAQGTRSAFFGVQSGLGQVKALEAAEASSQSALDANKLGYQVGVRINIDVLNSQSQLYQTKRDLAKARYDVLVGGLKLRQANGTLKPGDLQAVNALLGK